MKTKFLILLLLVAAAPQHLVTMEFANGGSIVSIERINVDPESYMAGSWTLIAVDERGEIHGQNTFTPEVILADGRVELIDELSVVLDTPALAREIRLLNPEGEVVDNEFIRELCGDGICGPTEVCKLDCTETLVETAVVKDEGVSTNALFAILGIALLLIVIVAAYHHATKPKPKPEQEEWNT